MGTGGRLSHNAACTADEGWLYASDFRQLRRHLVEGGAIGDAELKDRIDVPVRWRRWVPDAPHRAVLYAWPGLPARALGARALCLQGPLPPHGDFDIAISGD